MAVERVITEWQLDESDRHSLRAAVLQKWSQEAPGTADKFERYKYNVETLADGSRIFLHRPAWKNKGCDFEVHCDPAMVGNRKRPSHTDLINELSEIAAAGNEQKKQLLRAVEQVYQCQTIETVCAQILPSLQEPWKLKAERALKVAKWLFIEQDITDWNTSGRAMLMDGIRDTLGADAEQPAA